MSQERKIISLSAVGLDAPGLVSLITSRIFDLGGNIIDVEENCRRGLFSIFLIIDFEGSRRPMEDIVESLNRMGETTGLKVVVGVYDEKDIRYGREREGVVVTVLGEDRPGVIARISGLLHGYHVNIDSCRMIARGRFFSMELVIDTSGVRGKAGAESMEGMKAALKDLCQELNQSVVIQSEDGYRRGKRLVVFDVESTLVEASSLAAFLRTLEGRTGSRQDGLAPVVSAEGDRLQALLRNALKLKGIPMADFQRFSETLQVQAETLELIRILKSMGFKIALLSSGFNFFIKKIFESAGVDYAFSNTPKADERGILTGELEEPVITAASKGEILDLIMNMENLKREEVIAVGDGSEGCHFIENVGLSIALRPERMSIQTDGVLGGDQITAMLYCLGIPGHELERHLLKKDRPTGWNGTTPPGPSLPASGRDPERT